MSTSHERVEVPGDPLELVEAFHKNHARLMRGARRVFRQPNQRRLDSYFAAVDRLKNSARLISSDQFFPRTDQAMIEGSPEEFSADVALNSLYNSAGILGETAKQIKPGGYHPAYRTPRDVILDAVRDNDPGELYKPSGDELDDLPNGAKMIKVIERVRNGYLDVVDDLSHSLMLTPQVQAFQEQQRQQKRERTLRAQEREIERYQARQSGIEPVVGRTAIVGVALAAAGYWIKNRKKLFPRT